MKRVIRASGGSKEQSRIIRIQFDVEIPPGEYVSDFITLVNDAVSDLTYQFCHIANSDIEKDVTAEYERKNPEAFVYRNDDNSVEQS